MNAKIVVYKQPNKSKSVQLSRALHGYIDRSNHGQYTYERDGFLDKITYKKVYKGVFILREKDAEEFKKLLDKYDATYYIGPVEISSESLDSI